MADRPIRLIQQRTQISQITQMEKRYSRPMAVFFCVHLILSNLRNLRLLLCAEIELPAETR